MMHMTFYWGRTVTILFDSWKTDSWFSYCLSLFACFLFAVFYQYMEETRLRLKSPPPPPASAAATPLLRPKTRGGRWAPSRFAGAFLFGVNSAIGYLLMLAIMSFNAGVFVAVVVGLAVGYLVFRGGDVEEEAAAVVVDSACGCA